jgi:hypothetical protein
MDMNEFNGAAIKTEHSEHVYFDLRPFGNRQGEAMDSYLHEAVMSIQMGVSSFGERQIVLVTDASMVIPKTARTWLASLQESGVSVAVEARRP